MEDTYAKMLFHFMAREIKKKKGEEFAYLKEKI